MPGSGNADFNSTKSLLYMARSDMTLYATAVMVFLIVSTATVKILYGSSLSCCRVGGT